MNKKIFCVVATVVALAGSVMLAALARAGCAHSWSCDHTDVTPVSYDNTGCGNMGWNGEATGNDVWYASGAGNLQVVKYAYDLTIYNNVGTVMASNGSVKAFGCNLVDCFPPNDQEDSITVSTSRCECVNEFTYKGLYHSKYDYNTTTNEFDEVNMAISTGTSPP